MKAGSQADQIRQYVVDHFIQPARRRGATTVAVTAGEIVRGLKLRNRTPAVCSALTTRGFLKRQNIELVDADGPPSGQSTTMKFTYRLTRAAEPEAQSTDPWLKLHGIMRGMFDEDGGGEAFLRRERAHFYGNKGETR